ncbi:MAG: hypothetical protein LBK95_03850, partial [Bifidobacteriaceae bacterium]|nr:hypothetical protein [Bifidobacteriaceae bacterium]
GSDEPFARLIGRLERADPVERDRLLARFPAVAATAPIAERTGGRRTETPGGIAQTMTMLARQGQAPVVSGAEAVARSFESGHSFIPVIYVSDPASVTGLEPARLSSRRVMFLLPVTDNVTACSRDLGRFRGVCPEWGVLDTLASPGRQAEFGLDMLAELRGAAR